MQKKNDLKLIKAQIIILAIVLSAILLPQVIGTTTVATNTGSIVDLPCFNNMTCATITNDSVSNSFQKYFPDSKSVDYASKDEAITSLLSGDSDYMLCKMEDAVAIQDSNPELLIYPEDLSILLYSESEPGTYLICRKSDYAYGISNMKIADFDQNNMRIACLSGLTIDSVLKEKFPNATIDYYNTNLDVYTAVVTGNADFSTGYAMASDDVLKEYPSIAKLYEPLSVENNCFVAPKTQKGETLVNEFNAFIKDITASGEYDKICKKWREGNEDNYYLDEYNYSGENGTLNIVTGGSWVPMTFYYNDELTGLFIELSCKFCEEYGYIPNFSVADYSSELAGVTVGEYDFMADIASATEERKQSVCLTDTMYTVYNKLYTSADEMNTETVSKLSNTTGVLSSKFTKTFITQSRYKAFLRGLGTTMLLAVLSAFFGTLLGAIICFLRMSKNIYVQAFGRLYIKIAQGMPIVVLLLLLFYVIFSGTPVTGFWVCVIGFSLDFSAYVSEIFRSGIEAVDPGQKKAALALGFSNKEAFINVVMPQAARHILPVYSGQFISLVKITSVAGYIAVQDLTKASDLIRSATYEAFFPLIATALIYFILASLLILLLKLLESKIDISKRSRIPKGVKTND